MERDLTDEELVSRIQEGGASMFRILVTRYKDALLNYIARHTGRAGDAEDLLQELFIRVYRSIGTFDTARRFKPWIYRIATNICCDHAKKRKDTLSLDREYGSGTSDTSVTLMDFIADEHFRPEEDYLHKELLNEVRTRIEGLPAGQREAFLLFHYEGMQYKDIATALGIPVGTVKSRLHNACRRIFLEMQPGEGRAEA